MTDDSHRSVSDGQCVRYREASEERERDRERERERERSSGQGLIRLKMSDTPKSLKKRGSGRTTAIVYAVQCEECFKWRQMSTQEEFEEIRSKFIDDPFVCNKKANVSCEDPADLEYDSTRLWVIDKPNIPKTPAGFKRELVLRGDFSKMDAYYTTPAGKRLRATSGVASFLEANPEYQGLSTSDFSFTPPKVMDDTIPDNVERKGPSSLNKGTKTSSNGEDNA